MTETVTWAVQQALIAASEANALRHGLEQTHLKRGPGGGNYDDMDGRVSKLEAYMEHVREDVSEIKQSLAGIAGKLDGLAEKIGALPTKSDVTAWKIQWTALSLAVVAITVGGIIGGLAWIQPAPEKPSPTPPIVITVPK